MVPDLIVLLKAQANLVEPHHLVAEVLSQCMQQLATIGPSSILALGGHDCFLSEFERPLGYLLLLEYCSEVAHYFYVLLRILNGSNRSRATLILFKWLHIFPKITPFLKRNEFIGFWHLLFSLHY